MANALNLAIPIELDKGGTGQALTDPAADRIMFWDDSESEVTWLEVSTGLTLTGTTLTATGSGTGGGYATVNQTGASVTMTAGTQYINTSAANAQVTYTTPAAAALGDSFRIIGVFGNTGGWILSADTGQVIDVGASPTSSGGTVTFNAATDVIEIVCTVANTRFTAVGTISQDLVVA